MQLKKAKGAERERLDSRQLTLKLLANSTSYGIFVEVNVGELDRPERRVSFASGGDAFEVETDKDEAPGTYFHPLIATLITGGARLMLAITESLIAQKGLERAFCDTDSMAIAKPDDMDREVFITETMSVCDWFAPLNPYAQGGSILKTEDQNYALDGSGALAPLYCLAVSSKRYALFNVIDGEIIIRKASGHGLGHFLPPYAEADAPTSIPAPGVALQEIGVERWQYDLWYKIIEAELAGHGDEVDLTYHPALNAPAASRYGATTPKLLSWFKHWNMQQPARGKLRPFGFLLSFQHLDNFWSAMTQPDPSRRGRRPKKQKPKPVAPYDKDVRRAARKAFDRMTGQQVERETLMTYRQALAQYHVSPEMKFGNGKPYDRGPTIRLHIRVTSIAYIGKEANRWEEQLYTGEDEDLVVEYSAADDVEALDQRMLEVSQRHGERGTASRLGISRGTLRKALAKGSIVLSGAIRRRVRAAIG